MSRAEPSYDSNRRRVRVVGELRRKRCLYRVNIGLRPCARFGAAKQDLISMQDSSHRCEFVGLLGTITATTASEVGMALCLADDDLVIAARQEINLSDSWPTLKELEF
jgi:hypothetical protein